MSRGHDLKTLADLRERHHGKTVTVTELTGRLDGVIPVGNGAILALCVGGRRIWTDRLPATTPVEIYAIDGNPPEQP